MAALGVRCAAFSNCGTSGLTGSAGTCPTIGASGMPVKRSPGGIAPFGGCPSKVKIRGASAIAAVESSSIDVILRRRNTE